MLGRGARRLAQVASVALVGALLVGGQAAGEPSAEQASFGSQPSLLPRQYSPGIHDYVVRCKDAPVTITGHSSGSWRMAIAGHPYRSGDFSESVPLATGQELVIRVRKVGDSRIYHYYVRCLPDPFPHWTFKRYGPVSPKYFSVDQAFRGSLDQRYAIIFDDHGVPLWWFHTAAWGPRVLPSGTLLWFDFYSNQFEIHRLDGSLVRTLDAIGQPANPHDLQLLGNGQYQVGANVTQRHVDTSAYGGSSDASVMNAELQQVSSDGQLLWDWKSQDHISLAETGHRWPWVINHAGFGGYDIVHWNSIVPDGGSVIASFRNLDAVYKIDKSTGKIVWKLGGTATPESLAVKRDPRGHTLGAQHDAHLLPDDTLTVFDNRTNLDNHQPRAVRFRIDESNRSATLLQSITDPEVPTSNCCGSARLLGNGNWLIDWGQNQPIGGYTSDGERTFLLAYDSTFSYRAEPVPSGAISTPELRQGMDAIYGF